MEQEREYYTHDGGCPANNFTNLNERRLKTCLDCAGVFDKDGKGVATTDRRFDENYEVWLEAEHPEEYAELLAWRETQ